VGLQQYNKTTIAKYIDAGLTVMPTFGGLGLSQAAYEQRETNAEAIAAWVVEVRAARSDRDGR
jgi:hypothetical protein